MGVALLERAPRPHGFCPCQAPALPFALHAVLDYTTAGRRHDAGADRQACGPVGVVGHPAPVVVKERDDWCTRLPHRFPPPLLGEEWSPAADDVPPRPRRSAVSCCGTQC